jgi:long-chain fatty acid transport protein
MKTNLFACLVLISSTFVLGQNGHVLQGVGSVNWSMGGAATGQPIDIAGALQWNPAAISVFDETSLKLDIGLFSTSSDLFSSVPEFDSDGMPTGNFISGTTEGERPSVPLPSLAFVYGKAESQHTFGFSAFGISGAGVTFPESTTNPINLPQEFGGLGRIESDYSILQIGLTYAYQISDKFSIGVAPNFNLSGLELMPNPTAMPTQAGYPSSDKATATAIGAQFGVFFDSKSGFKAGIAYKTKLNFSDLELENTYLDGTTSNNSIEISYPSILSFGLGYSKNGVDIALDYRYVDFENAEGLADVGWSSMGTTLGFGWKNMSVMSAGIQYKGIEKLPLRIGYTYSSNPIESDVAFFNVVSTAIIKHAFQFGFSYVASPRINLEAVFHYGTSAGKTSGPINSPLLVNDFPPYGAFPGSEVSYDLKTTLIMAGISYTFKKKTIDP